MLRGVAVARFERGAERRHDGLRGCRGVGVRPAAGADPEIFGDHPWMDAAFTAAAGIPTVVFGPHGAGAHAVEEYGDIASVERCAAVLTQTAQRLCA